jgi:hypothetical protein
MDGEIEIGSSVYSLSGSEQEQLLSRKYILARRHNSFRQMKAINHLRAWLSRAILRPRSHPSNELEVLVAAEAKILESLTQLKDVS